MSSAFTPDDVRVLEKTLSIRERMLDNLVSQEKLPTDPESIRSFVNLLDSTDKNVFGRAKIKVEESSNKVNEETNNILGDLVLKLHSGVIPEGLGLDDGAVIPKWEGSSEVEVLEGELIRRTDDVGIEILDDM